MSLHRENLLTTEDLAVALGVSSGSVRVYARIGRALLSEYATDGRQRRYTPGDTRIISYIRKRKQDGASEAVILDELQGGMRGDMIEATHKEIVIHADNLTEIRTLTIERDNLRREVIKQEGTIETLKEELERSRKSYGDGFRDGFEAGRDADG